MVCSAPTSSPMLDIIPCEFVNLTDHSEGHLIFYPKPKLPDGQIHMVMPRNPTGFPARSINGTPRNMVGSFLGKYIIIHVLSSFALFVTKFFC